MNPPNSPILKRILTACLVLFPILSHAQAPYAVWTKAYNGTGNFRDEAQAIVVDTANNVIVTGNSDGVGGLIEIATVKYSAIDGSILWERRHAEAGFVFLNPLFMAADRSGDVIVAGLGGPSSTQTDVIATSFIAKYASADGALLWFKTNTVYGNLDLEVHNGLSVDSSGNVIVVGGSDGYFRIAKYAATDGAILWNQSFKVGIDGKPNSVAVDAAGNVIVCGNAFENEWPYRPGHYVAKLAASNGALLWENRSINTFGSVVAIDPYGNIFMAGNFPDEGFGVSKIWMVKYAAFDGSLLWQNIGNNSSYIAPRSIAVDAAGDVAVTGDQDFSGAGGSIYTAKYTGNSGSLMWENVYSGPNGFDYATSLAMDNSGNVIMAGKSEGNGYESDFYITKYASFNGRRISEYRYEANSRPQRSQTPVIALDSSGHVFISGTTILPNNMGEDYLTLKVAMLETPDVSVQTPAPVGSQPSIVVQQPPGSTLMNGANKIFGRVKIGKSGAARLFTITNTGTSVLSGIGVSLGGPHGKDFVLTKPRKTTLAPGCLHQLQSVFQAQNQRDP